MTGEPAWDDLLSAAAAFQQAVLVGGSAAALHAAHRLSTDTDHTIGDLRDCFEELLDFLEQRPDWKTARVTPPVVILGNFQGVETTLRQMRRTRPLETIMADFGGTSVRVPTVAEMIRVKGWLALTRNAFRDHLDLAALTAQAGEVGSGTAMKSFHSAYSDVDHDAVDRLTSPLLQLVRQLAEPKPGDLSRVGEVARYKAIVERWNSWKKIVAQCKLAAVWMSAALMDLSPDPAG